MSYASIAQNLNPIKLGRDILRLIRSALAVANHFFELEIIEVIVQAINAFLGDIQFDPEFSDLKPLYCDI